MRTQNLQCRTCCKTDGCYSELGWEGKAGQGQGRQQVHCRGGTCDSQLSRKPERSWAQNKVLGVGLWQCSFLVARCWQAAESRASPVCCATWCQALYSEGLLRCIRHWALFDVNGGQEWYQFSSLLRGVHSMVWNAGKAMVSPVWPQLYLQVLVTFGWGHQPVCSHLAVVWTWGGW